METVIKLFKYMKKPRIPKAWGRKGMISPGGSFEFSQYFGLAKIRISGICFFFFQFSFKTMKKTLLSHEWGREGLISLRVLFILLLFGFSSNLCKAQFGATIVNDPMNYGQLALIAEEGVEQTAKLQQSISLLEAAKNAVEKVNSTIKTLAMVEKCIDLSQNTINQINTVTTRLGKLDNADPKLILVTTNYCTRCARRATENVALLTTILTDGGLKMNDSERYKLIIESMVTLEQLTYSTNSLIRRVERIESKTQALLCL